MPVLMIFQGQIDPVTKKTPFYHTFASGILAGSISAYLATPLDGK